MGPVAATVPWQALGRRLGLPFHRPDARTALAVVPATLAAAAVAAATVQGAARLAAGTPGRPRTPAGAGIALAVDPFPVLGPYAAAVADTMRAAALAPRGVRGRPWRIAGATVVLLAGRQAAWRALDAALSAGAPPPPGPAPADTTLNVLPAARPGVHGPEGFVVYFDGVGRATRRTTPVGRDFAEAVHRRLPTWTVVMSLMPNDVTQRPAWERPVTGPLWRALGHRSRDWLVARGVWEGIVALDGRYRRRLVAGHTSAVRTHLLAAGYRPGSGIPIVLVGLSAGAQTALRVASDVARALGGAPLDVVTLGGFSDGAADLSGVRRVHAAVSWGDPAELAPVPFLPSRWTALHVGAWSRARRRRTVVVHRFNYATHVGRTGYLGRAAAPDGRTRRDQSADLVQRAARELADHAAEAARRPGRPAGRAPGAS
jgi:hypothetical protein